MESAIKLRRVITKLAKRVGSEEERVSVNTMIDFCSQIKKSSAGHFSHSLFVYLLLLK
jgi:hypothetical protein